MRILAGPDAHIHFTSLSEPSQRALMTSSGSTPTDIDLARVSYHTTGILDLDLLSSTDTHPKLEPSSLLHAICLLDPKSDTPLSPADGDGRFHTFLFGVRQTEFPPCLVLPSSTPF